MTDLTEEEREAYAEPGTFLRKMIDDGIVPWPTREELIHEDMTLAFLSGVDLTVGGVTAMMEAVEDAARSAQDARSRPSTSPTASLSSSTRPDAPHDIKRK